MLALRSSGLFLLVLAACGINAEGTLDASVTEAPGGASGVSGQGGAGTSGQGGAGAPSAGQAGEAGSAGANAGTAGTTAGTDAGGAGQGGEGGAAGQGGLSGTSGQGGTDAGSGGEGGQGGGGAGQGGGGAGGSGGQASCDDGEKNGTETGVDCGGSCAKKCLDGDGCKGGGDCVSGVCDAELCQSPSCNDGLKNGLETDVDCGGDACLACKPGEVCVGGADCDAGVCVGGLCQAPSCTDGVRNGDETAADCGGTCLACPDGSDCNTDGDCVSQVCASKVCLAPHCKDGIQNTGETDIDCGGTCAPYKACENERSCVASVDCQSGLCVGDRCFAPGTNTAAPAGGGPAPMGCPTLAGQTSQYKATNGHCYHLFLTLMPWYDAWKSCVSLGGHLATFDTDAEADEVEQALVIAGNTWIGAYCQDGVDCTNRASWRWLGDQPIAFDDWLGPTIPNGATERCLRILAGGPDGYGFDNQVCGSLFFHLCEIGD